MITNFLASVLGWYLVIVSLLLILRSEIVVAAMRELIGHRAVMLVVGILTLMIGLLMVISHNIWIMGWPVIITIIAWLVLIGGLFRLFFPDIVYKIWNKTIDKPNKLIVCGIIILIIGLFLLYKVHFG
jgi:cytochrome bd-type quinol oxidase subunit 2